MPVSLSGDDASYGNPPNLQNRRPLPVLKAAAVSRKMPSGMLVPVLSEAAFVNGVARMTVFGVRREATPPDDLLLPPTPLEHSP